jgi:hypothetical protein
LSEENTVRQLRPSPAVEVPAIGCSFTTNLGGDRQIVLQTHFAGDEDEAAINARIDRILRIGDRQKAKYDLEKVEAEFRTVGNAIVDMIAAIPVAARNHAKTTVEKAATVEGLRAQQEQVRSDAYAEFTDSGKRGAFQMKGHAATNYARIQAEINKVEESVRAAENERAQWLQTQAANIERFRRDLISRREKLNAMRTLAGYDPCTEYADAETCPVEGL